ncbi:MAG: cupin domain-containing protein [Clostridioides sp.]|jgi:mannose-6-phosphate isomerase-like protein (cupin superfamily)|nr:cupin domain-containing protein [Clostridioides sp.]
MSENFILDAKFEENPVHKGVYMKYLFGKEDNDRLSNVEIMIIPGFQISPHTHEDSTEFFYIVGGEGEYLDGDEWKYIKRGDAFKAPKGRTHGIKNTGDGSLVIFSTFSPGIR